VWACLGLTDQAAGETYGTKNAQGLFTPKVTVTVGKKEVLIKKIDPGQQFRIAIAIGKNRTIERNVGHLNVEWIGPNNVPGKPMPFSGPHYNNITKVFQDFMKKSIALKIVEKTAKPLFEGKPLEDLFTITIDDEPLISSESASEKDRTVQLGTGKDVSISYDKQAIEFNESNLRQSEILNVDNRSGLEQVIGVELPDKELLFFQKIVRKPEQRQIPQEEWDRFTLGPGAGVSIVLIPESDPASLTKLNGKDVLIKIYQGNRVREAKRVPIRVAADIRTPGRTAPSPEPSSVQPPTTPQRTGPSPPQPRPAPASNGWGGVLLWGLQIANLGLLVSLGIYGIFFMLPKIQVLEDRLAKNEMFIHGTREAIREELDQIKEEIVRQCEEECREDHLPE
jgi:hypothetical protein